MPRWLFPLLSGLLATLVTGLGAPALLRIRIDWGLDISSWLAPAAVFLSYALVWWLLITRPQRPTFGRVLVGSLTAMTLALLLVFGAALVVEPKAAPPAGFPANLVYLISGPLVFTFGRMLMGGWLYAVINAAWGAPLALWERRTLPGAAGQPGPGWGRVLLGAFGIVLMVVVALGAWLWLTPAPLGDVTVTQAPVEDYATAVAAITAIQAAEAAVADKAYQINPVCQTQLLTHGEKTAKAIVLLHGFTNCPAQYAAFAQELYDQGYNVLIPRLPHHGLADRMTTDLDNLTAEELVTAGNQAVDLAQGLGEEVSVFGFSAGGALASWLAQTRSDLAQATVAAPLFGPGGFSPALVQPIANLFRLLPNQFVWWNEAVQDRPEPPLHAYPRYSRRGVGEALRLALLTKYQADAMAPATHDLRVITNGNENSVSNEATSELVRPGASGCKTQPLNYASTCCPRTGNSSTTSSTRPRRSSK